MPPPAETTSAKIRANCGVEVRLSRSPRHPRDATGKRIYRSVLPPSVSFASLLISHPAFVSLALNVRYREMRLNFSCLRYLYHVLLSDVRYRVLTLRYRKNLFF